MNPEFIVAPQSQEQHQPVKTTHPGEARRLIVPPAGMISNQVWSPITTVEFRNMKTQLFFISLQIHRTSDR
jgi:hypothetical protein